MSCFTDVLCKILLEPPVRDETRWSRCRPTEVVPRLVSRESVGVGPRWGPHVYFTPLPEGPRSSKDTG